ncbi:hypothetical protein [Gemmatimonas sp.]|uniref:hypothetical protein n=1 Tax=Gemmatimonas sp. TaxID=1962908 RepID=UPI0022CA977E|nr:hypothetical protein [Gemmatimonas sp.]MCZ8204754.1 hypothetical protein [Gemmatimonas sp.]
MDLRRQPIVAIGDNGQIAITDGATFVGVADASGRVQRVGRAGSGPGEIQQTSALGWVGDTLWVIDSRLRRITWFHAGRLHHTVSFVGGRRSGQLLDLPMALTPLGAVAPSMGDGQAATLYKPRRWSLFLASPDGAQVRDSLFDMVDPAGALTVKRGNGTMVLRQPYSLRTLVGWSGNGTWLVRADRASQSEGPLGGTQPHISLRDARGRIVYDVPLPIAARTLPPAEVARLVDSAVATLNRNPRLPPTTTAEYRRALAVPPRVPAVSQLVVRNDGSVLLRPWPAPDGQADHLVIAADGRVRNTLRLPPGVHILAADTNRIIATRENDDGDVDIVVFDLTQRQR